MAEHSLDAALYALLSLRDKWGFYTAGIRDGERAQFQKLKEQLESVISLWLLDAYTTVHDHVRRNLIVARKSRKKFPNTLDRQQLASTVLKRLFLTKMSIAQASNTLLGLHAATMEKCLATAERYFEDTPAFLAALSPEECETLLFKLSTLTAEEELPVG